MSRVVELLCSRRVPHVAVLALMSIGFAGCSADMSTRLSQNPFPIPLPRSRKPPARCRRPAVERRELPQYARPQSQYQSQALPPPIAAPQSYPAANAGVSGGGRGLASYAPPAHPRSRPPAASRRVRSRRPMARHRAAPRSSSAPATRWKCCRAATTFRPPRSCRPMATRVRASLSPGQQLIIPRPTAAAAAPAWRRRPASRLLPRRSAIRSRRQSRRHADQHRAPQSHRRWRTRQGQQPRAVGEAQARHEAHRAGREDRSGCAGCAAGRCCRSAAAASGAARDQNGGRDSRSSSKSARLAQATTKVEERCRLKRRSRPPRQPARCRRSAGRCAAR